MWIVPGEQVGSLNESSPATEERNKANNTTFVAVQGNSDYQRKKKYGTLCPGDVHEEIEGRRLEGHYTIYSS